MSKYRKKPVVIDAWQWLFSPKQDETPSWVTDALWLWPKVGGIAFEPDKDRIAIATLEGVMTASPGDFIIKGIKGEIYACKPDIFEATYDAVPEAA
jgi:hypothetical protein